MGKSSHASIFEETHIIGIVTCEAEFVKDLHKMRVVAMQCLGGLGGIFVVGRPDTAQTSRGKFNYQLSRF